MFRLLLVCGLMCLGTPATAQPSAPDGCQAGLATPAVTAAPSPELINQNAVLRVFKRYLENRLIDGTFTYRGLLRRDELALDSTCSVGGDPLLEHTTRNVLERLRFRAHPSSRRVTIRFELRTIPDSVAGDTVADSYGRGDTVVVRYQVTPIARRITRGSERDRRATLAAAIITLAAAAPREVSVCIGMDHGTDGLVRRVLTLISDSVRVLAPSECSSIGGMVSVVEPEGGAHPRPSYADPYWVTLSVPEPWTPSIWIIRRAGRGRPYPHEGGLCIARRTGESWRVTCDLKRLPLS